MPVPLFTPSAERIATSNAWACLCLLAPARAGAAPPADGATIWAALRTAIATAPPATLAAFAAVPPHPAPLALPRGSAAALVHQPAAGPARVFSADSLAEPGAELPVPVVPALARVWDPARLLALRLDLLLHLDLRPDDVVLLAGVAPTDWLPALSDGTRLILVESGPEGVLACAADARATVLAAPAGWIDAAAFPRRPRPHLGALRSVIALGGPTAPGARERVYAWIKPDVMLLARAGDRFWGNPLSPVQTRPTPEPPLLPAQPARPVGWPAPRGPV